MSTVRCEDCGTLWLSAPPADRVTPASGEGCLRCNGTLRPASTDAIAEALGDRPDDPVGG